MKLRNLCSVLVMPAMLYGCGSSSSGSAPVANPLTNPTTDNVAIPTTSPSNVLASQVYDPNSPLTNTCSSPFYQAVAGIYEGTFTVQDNIRRSCQWSVRLSVARFYDNINPVTALVSSGIYNLDVTYSGVATQLPPPVEFDDEGNEIEDTTRQLVCLDFETTGEINGPFGEPDSSNLNFPLEESYFYDREIDLQDGSGITAAAVADPGASSFSSIVDFWFLANGNVTFPETQLINPTWTGELEKVASDLD